jgi:hypothetical protein
LLFTYAHYAHSIPTSAASKPLTKKENIMTNLTTTNNTPRKQATANKFIMIFLKKDGVLNDCKFTAVESTDHGVLIGKLLLTTIAECKTFLNAYKIFK